MNAINWMQVLAGALVGWIVAVLFVDPIKALRDKAWFGFRRTAGRAAQDRTSWVAWVAGLAVVLVVGTIFRSGRAAPRR